MQIELPKICYFKNDGQKFMVLAYVGVSDQEEKWYKNKVPTIWVHSFYMV